MASPSSPQQPVSAGLSADSMLRPPPMASTAKRGKKPDPKRKVAENPRQTPRRNSLRRAKNSTEELRARTRQRGASASTVDATTAGRSFTVGNINNGFIYLRPVVRPGNQRNTRPAPPDPFVFPPATPPNSAPLDSLEPRRADNTWRETVYSDTEVPDAKKDLADSKPARRVTRSKIAKAAPTPKRVPHVRSHSFSSTHDQTPSPNADRTFRVVIERPSISRPKTAESASLPQLEVPIPHYRLGTPRFSARGTAILRSSIYTRTSATEDFRSSVFSYTRGDHERLFPSPMGNHSSYLSRRHSEAYPGWKRNTGMTSGGLSSRTSLGPVEPQLYDIYTTNPEDPSVVRFSSTGEIIAATPSRLVAHITSPSFVDYDLLGHFFLTFRAFLSVNDLLNYLIARLRWAVNRSDDFGRIVRVRTFVALRHWILNYFVDDFLPDFHFREQFCTLINGLYDELRARDDGGGGDLKIVSELKRCWRRTCAEYWEPVAAVQELPDSPISPGGSRPSVSSRDATQPPKPKKQVTMKRSKPEVLRLGTAEAAANKHFEWFREARHVPQQSLTSANISSQRESHGMPPLSPASELSMQVLSCSIPMRALTRWEPDQDIPLFPHPVPHQAISPPPYAASIKPGHRVHGHKRSGSFSDALRDSRGPLPLRKNSLKEATVSPAATGPGSLVRGAMFQPGTPYIDIKYPTHFISRAHLDMPDVSSAWANSKGLATSPGMKRIIGSVRRALSSKQPAGHGNPVVAMAAAAAAAAEPMPGAQPNRVSQPATVDTGTSSRPSQHRKKLSREHGQVRIDLLAERVGDSFRQAIVEELELEKQGRRSLLASNIGNMHSFIQSPTPQESSNLKPDIGRINSSVTQGSRSIVIVDDTGAPPLPMMSGALVPPPPAVPVVYNFSRPLTSRGTSIRGQRSTYQGQTEHMRQASNVNSSFDVGSGSQGPTSSGSAQQTSNRERSSSRMDRSHSSARSQSVGSLRRYASYNSSILKPPPVVGASVAPTSRAVTASSDDDPFHLERVPVNRLRRRPGGDLRAVDNVHDLETPLQQRRHSAGSISIRSQSFVSSAPVTSAEVAPLKLGRRQDESASGESGTDKKPLSLMATHSSQPNLRPSFEAEVAKLAALPDDDDDGGVESALMKLEGRYEKRSPDTKSAPISPLDSLGPEEVLEGVSLASKTPSPGPALGLSIQDELDVVHAREVSHKVHQRNFDGSQSAIESEDSYNSIPLLQRGLSDATITWRKPSPQQGVPPVEALRGASPDSSIEYVHETASMKRIPPGETMPRPADAHASFEPDDDKHLTKGTFLTDADGSDDDSDDGVRSFFSDEPANLERESGTFFHPLRHPPTPPLTAETNVRHGSPVETITKFQMGLPTPGLSPVSKGAEPVLKPASPPLAPVVPLPEPTIVVSKETKQAKRASQLAHLPFIMAYNSETLAQQFTIIEKDALDEIDWKELIELRWKQSSPLVKDWVEYLRTQEPQGVDVVIARFNMVVKWAVSEILLTENIEERAKTIIKIIHIAQHTRKLRNYATMYQLTIALLSSDVARLLKTWEYIPAVEKHTLRQLEELIQPVRNFHNLRVEMETASLEEGCIPFVGIYTRDLVYNGQKPEFIGRSHTNGGEWLVNFERCHVAATIVKSLLRLLEASSNYKFAPDPSIISKCLWLAALTDEEIVSLSKKVE